MGRKNVNNYAKAAQMQAQNNKDEEYRKLYTEEYGYSLRDFVDAVKESYNAYDARDNVNRMIREDGNGAIKEDVYFLIVWSLVKECRQLNKSLEKAKKQTNSFWVI